MGTTPPSWTSREARWQAKQAARAQREQWKAQMRAQKEYYKSYWRGWHRPSFVGPIILLSIGVILSQTQSGSGFWQRGQSATASAANSLFSSLVCSDIGRLYAGRRPASTVPSDSGIMPGHGGPMERTATRSHRTAPSPPIDGSGRNHAAQKPLPLPPGAL